MQHNGATLQHKVTQCSKVMQIAMQPRLAILLATIALNTAAWLGAEKVPHIRRCVWWDNVMNWCRCKSPHFCQSWLARESDAPCEARLAAGARDRARSARAYRTAAKGALRSVREQAVRYPRSLLPREDEPRQVQDWEAGGPPRRPP